MSKSGGCLCEAVSYASTAEPLAKFLCHCKNCQKQSGSAFSMNIIFPKPQFEYEGPTSIYIDENATGKKVHRHFCTSCGTPLFSTYPHMPDVILLKAGSLDDSASYEPAGQIWCDSRQDWVKFETDYPEFAKMPPMGTPMT